jgi:hypothetical protein
VGWNVAPALACPASAWDIWNLDALVDSCEALGIDWREVVPA